MKDGRSLTTGLIERDDSILLVIDFQDGFLAKLSETRAARLIDHGRFVMEVALECGVLAFVTVEDPAGNGPTVAPLRDLLGPEPPDRDKRVFGLCGQPDLRDAMLAQPRRTAVLIGMETDVCILHTAVGLIENGFRAIIVSDATGSPGDEHQFGLARASALGVELIHAKGLYYEWLRSIAGVREMAERRAIAPPQGSAL